MTLLGFFEACERSALGEAIRQSVWLFPAIEALHLLALGLLGGAVLMLDLRLLGWGLRSLSPASLERQTRPWLIAALVGLVATGVPLFLSESLKLYASNAFWLKMAALGAALVHTFWLRNPVARRSVAASVAPSPGNRLLALVSLALWLVVAVAGRWIGFS